MKSETTHWPDAPDREANRHPGGYRRSKARVTPVANRALPSAPLERAGVRPSDRSTGFHAASRSIHGCFDSKRPGGLSRTGDSGETGWRTRDPDRGSVSPRDGPPTGAFFPCTLRRQASHCSSGRSTTPDQVRTDHCVSREPVASAGSPQPGSHGQGRAISLNSTIRKQRYAVGTSVFGHPATTEMDRPGVSGRPPASGRIRSGPP